MITDIEQLIINRLTDIERKVDQLVIDVAEIRGGRKAIAAVAAGIGAIVAAVASRWWR